MKTIKTYATSLFAATLVAGTLFGCGGQPQAAQQDAAGETATEATSGSEAAASEEVADELKAAMKAASAYQSVTLTHRTVMDGDTEKALDTVAKFDLSGERTTSSITYKLSDSTYKTYYDGQDMVCDFGGGDVFKATADELDEDEKALSVEAFESDLLGQFDSIVASASTIEKTSVDGGVLYTLTLDPKLLAKHDEELAGMGADVSAATVSYEFDSDGRLVKLTSSQDTSFGVVDETVECSDYNSTVVDPAPETDRTLADHEAALEE